MTDCETEVRAYYYQPYDSSDKPAGWQEISPSENTDLSKMNADDGMYILWTPTQQDYINMVHIFGDQAHVAIENYVPPFLEFRMKFVTYDLADYTNFKEDEFTVKVFSNNETASDTCADAFAALSLKGEMYGTKSFDISDGKRKDIRVPIELLGADALSNECRDLIFINLEYLLDDTWLPIWTLH